MSVLARQTRWALCNVGCVAVKLEYFAVAARLIDESFFPLHRNGHGARLLGRQLNDAGAVLKDMPTAGFEPPSVFQRNPECRSSRAQHQVNSPLARSFGRIPYSGMNEAARTDQCAIHIDPYHPNH